MSSYSYIHHITLMIQIELDALDALDALNITLFIFFYPPVSPFRQRPRPSSPGPSSGWRRAASSWPSTRPCSAPPASARRRRPCVARRPGKEFEKSWRGVNNVFIQMYINVYIYICICECLFVY